MSQTTSQAVVLPGGTIGILGGGQLGRMTALAAKAMGYRVVVLTPDGEQAPAAQVADVTLVADYTNEAALSALAKQVDVVTQEFENIPAHALTWLETEGGVPVHPSPQVLHTCQHRLREKQWLQANNCPVAPFYPIPDVHALEAIPDDCLPGVLKTAGFGYDGKGQIRVKTRFDVIAAFNKLGNQPCVLESWIDLAMELSVIAARNTTGWVAFPVAENEHIDHILRFSHMPAAISPELGQQAISLAGHIMTRMQVTGLLCVELFVTRDGQLHKTPVLPASLSSMCGPSVSYPWV
jgi:5-(carboxyamino)imidazole ribonucleotide synthase